MAPKPGNAALWLADIRLLHSRFQPPIFKLNDITYETCVLHSEGTIYAYNNDTVVGDYSVTVNS